VKFLTTVMKASSMLALACFSFTANADIYGVATVGYADVDTEVLGDSGVAFSGAIGYQFHKQWYVEGGYLSLVDESEPSAVVEATGAYLAVLGKAGSREGELFYKLGVANIDVTSIDAAACAADVLPCAYDDSVVAGLVGLGFDYFVGHRTMVRLEYTYVGGEDDFSANMVNVGVRYNF